MKYRVGICVMAALALLAVSSPAWGQGMALETADVVGQGAGGPVVSPEGAKLIRVKNGITISLSMPTPEPGSYNYPPPSRFQSSVLMGHPEVFTGWAFIFNFPDLCSFPCNSDDIGADKPAKGGVYNFSGHVSGGGNLQMSGHISVGQTPFGAAHAALENPGGAEVHVAIAPHGTLQPQLLPDQIQTPIGSGPFWWLAFFRP